MMSSVLTPAALKADSGLNGQLSEPIKFTWLTVALANSEFCMWQDDYKRWENWHRDLWRLQGQTILATDDESIWWPEGLADSYGVSNKELTQIVFLATEHRKMKAKKVHYLGALEFILNNSMAFFAATPIQIDNRLKAGKAAKHALMADLGLFKSDFDVYSSGLQYVKTVGHLTEYMDSDRATVKQDYQRILANQKLDEELLKGGLPGASNSTNKTFLKKLPQLTFGEKLLKLAYYTSMSAAVQPLNQKWAAYMGLKLTSIPGYRFMTWNEFASLVIHEYGEDYAIKHALYLLVELGGLFNKKLNYVVYDDQKVVLKTTCYFFDAYIPIIEQYALGPNKSGMRASTDTDKDQEVHIDISELNSNAEFNNGNYEDYLEFIWANKLLSKL